MVSELDWQHAGSVNWTGSMHMQGLVSTVASKSIVVYNVYDYQQGHSACAWPVLGPYILLVSEW